MISVDEALAQVFALVEPTEVEEVPLAQAAGRVLAKQVVARREQPPFSASAMDGYAICRGDFKDGTTLKVIGEAAAGRGFNSPVTAGFAVRIFTGAPVPEGADHVVIQEDVETHSDRITLVNAESERSNNIRPSGGDFREGDTIEAPRMISPSLLALLASMNIDKVPVHRKPVVALIATGDELVMPGETPGPDQIIASNNFGLKALVEAAGATARMLPIARDREASLAKVLDLASDADLIVTIGGASVGDHDLVGKVAADQGLDRAFYKVAMRPGKPLMAGRIGASAMLGLPGNPVSSMVCGHIFLLPALRKMLGLGEAAAPRETLKLSEDLPKNGPREHYMRAVTDGVWVRAFGSQDSSLLSILSRSDALIVRAPGDSARKSGEWVEVVRI